MLRLVSYGFGGLSALGAGGYLAVYLYRWEWQRALIAGLLLLVAEVFLVCMMLLSRMTRLEHRVAEALDPGTADVGRRLARRAEPEGNGASPFRWLVRDDGATANRTFVFVPVLIATGALLSAAAWVVQRVASATARSGGDVRLASRLSVLTAPAGGVRDPAPRPDIEDLPLLGQPVHGPGSGGWRRPVLGLGAVLALGALVAGLAALTQTRPERESRAEATAYLLRVSVRGDLDEIGREIMANRLWGSCRASTSSLLVNAPLSHVEGDVYAGVVRPALTGHDRMRLRGCLVDSQLDRVRFTVLGEEELGDDR